MTTSPQSANQRLRGYPLDDGGERFVVKRHTKSRPRAKGAVAKTTKAIGRMTKTIGDWGWEGLFASSTLARLLTTLLTRPEAAFYQRELADGAGTGLYAVQRELARLEKVGLVVRTPRGNRVAQSGKSRSVLERSP